MLTIINDLIARDLTSTPWTRDTVAIPVLPESERGVIMSKSEIAQLREQIAAEYKTARLGLEGLRYGTARHDFITARIERMGDLHTGRTAERHKAHRFQLLRWFA